MDLRAQYVSIRLDELLALITISYAGNFKFEGELMSLGLFDSNLLEVHSCLNLGIIGCARAGIMIGDSLLSTVRPDKFFGEFLRQGHVDCDLEP